MVFGPLSVSLAPYIQSSKTLSKWVTPVANWYANASRYRQYGFKYDDLGECPSRSWFWVWVGDGKWCVEGRRTVEGKRISAVFCISRELIGRREEQGADGFPLDEQ